MLIEEAIEIMNNFIKDTPKLPYECLANKEVEAIDTVLNELETSKKETQQVLDDYQDLGKEYYKLQCELEKKDAEIEYWKEQAEGYSGLAKTIEEDYKNRIYEFEQESE